MTGHRYAIVRSTVLAAAVLASGFLGGVIADRLAFGFFTSEAEEQNFRLIERFRAMSTAQRGLLKTLSTVDASCSDASLARLRAELYQQSGVRDVAVNVGGQVRCSAAFGQLETPVDLPAPFVITPRGVEHRLWRWPAQGGREVLSASSGGFEIVYNTETLAYDTSRHRLSLVLMDEVLHPRTFFGPPAPTGLQFSILPQRMEEGGVLFTHVCGGEFYLCVARSVSIDALRASFRGLILSGVLLGVVIGALAAAAAEFGLAFAQRPQNRARRLLRRGAYGFHYQPIVDLRDGEVKGAETLLRPAASFAGVTTSDVIDQAERMNYSGRVFRRGVEEAVAAFGHRLRGRRFRLTLNIAATDLVDPALPDYLASVCNEHGVCEDAITLELTERSTIDAPEVVAAVRVLRGRGFRLAIDDFGAGYSNLGYLGALDVHTIKIDRSLVAAAGTGSARERVVEHIIELGKELDLRLVAEGVETETEADFFRRRGVIRAQGWYFARDMAADEFEDWAKAWDERRTASPFFDGDVVAA